MVQVYDKLDVTVYWKGSPSPAKLMVMVSTYILLSLASLQNGEGVIGMDGVRRRDP
jgi:hypothetical protein